MTQCPQSSADSVWSITANIPQIWKINDGITLESYCYDLTLHSDITINEIAITATGYTEANSSSIQPSIFSSDIRWDGAVSGSFSFLNIDVGASVSFDTSAGLQDILY